MGILLWFVTSCSIFVATNKQIEDDYKICYFAVVALIVVLYVIFGCIL